MGKETVQLTDIIIYVNPIKV